MDNRSRSTSCKLNSCTTRVINTILYCGSCSLWDHHQRNSGLKSFKPPQEQADRIERVRWAVATPIVLCSYHKCWFYNFTTRQSFLPLTLAIFEWSLNSVFFFFAERLSTESKWISTVETSLRLKNISRSLPSIYAHTPVRTSTAKIWKNDTLFIFFLHQLIGMTFFLSSFYLLLFHNSDGVTGLFSPLNMHSGTTYIQHHLSAIATTFFGWRLCNFPLPVFTLL